MHVTIGIEIEPDSLPDYGEQDPVNVAADVAASLCREWEGTTLSVSASFGEGYDVTIGNTWVASD